MEVSGGLRDYAEGSSTSSAQGKEDVLVLAPVGGDECSVGQDHSHLQRVIDTESVGRRDDTVAAPKDPASGDSYRLARAPDCLYIEVSTTSLFYPPILFFFPLPSLDTVYRGSLQSIRFHLEYHRDRDQSDRRRTSLRALLVLNSPQA